MDSKVFAIGIVASLIIGLAGGFFVSGMNSTTETTTSLETKTSTETNIAFEKGSTLTTTQSFVAYSTVTESQNSTEIADLQSQIDGLNIQNDNLNQQINSFREIVDLQVPKGIIEGLINQSAGGTYSNEFTAAYSGYLDVLIQYTTDPNIIVQVSWKSSQFDYNQIENLSSIASTNGGNLYFFVMPSTVTVSVRDSNYQPFEASISIIYYY